MQLYVEALASLRSGRLGGDQAAPPPLHSKLLHLTSAAVAAAAGGRERGLWAQAGSATSHRCLIFSLCPLPTLLSSLPSLRRRRVGLRRVSGQIRGARLWIYGPLPWIQSSPHETHPTTLSGSWYGGPPWFAAGWGSCAWLARLGDGARWWVAHATSGGGAIAPLAGPRRRPPTQTAGLRLGARPRGWPGGGGVRPSLLLGGWRCAWSACLRS
jgi:hypothetical protein